MPPINPSKQLNRFTEHARVSFLESEKVALSCKASEIHLEHLLLAIFLRHGSAGSATLHAMGIEEESFISLFSPTLKNKTSSKAPSLLTKTLFSQTCKDIILLSYRFAYIAKSPYVGTEHVVQAILHNPPKTIISILSTLKNRKVSSKKRPHQKIPSSLMRSPGFPFQFSEEEDQNISALDEFCININERCLENKDLSLIGREDIIQRITHILGRRTKNNVLLLGDPGVGKTALVTGLAQKIEQGKLPHLRNKIIYEMDLAMLISGTSFRGEFEARIKDIIQEASQNPDIILFIDEIHTLVGAGNISGSLDAANILKPALARGDIRCIGATTFVEYKKHIEKDSALARRFQAIQVQEPSRNEAVDILQGLRGELESHHHVTFSEESLSFAVDMSIRHIPERFLPDKAIDLLDEASSSKRFRNTPDQTQSFQAITARRSLLEDAQLQKKDCIQNERYETALQLETRIKEMKKEINLLESKMKKEASAKKVMIEKKDIAETLASISGIPQEKILLNNQKHLLSLKKKLDKDIIGQSHATHILTKTLTRSFCGFSHTHRPLGSFLLLGPSGVGKTYTAKMLAQHLFDRENAIIRIDMSEFSERHQLSGLIGAPAGYVGYGEGGRFTEKLRKNPHSVVLFDEIEKAHPDILNILLQILEEGVLTDGEGHVVSLRESVLILTSNIGSSHIQNLNDHRLGFGDTKKPVLDIPTLEKHVRGELKTALRPELVDRLDHVIIYHPLSSAHIQKIVTKMLHESAKRLKENGYTLSWERSVLPFLVRQTMQSQMGARNIRKIIQDHVEDAIAQHIMENPSSKKFSLHTNKGILSVISL